MPKRNVPRPAAVYGIDIGKNIFHVVGLGSDGVPVQKVRFRRDTLLQFFERAAPAIVGMESCAGSQWIARKLQALGHKVRLIPAQFVKPYVKSNKSDIIDAEAIAEAATRPTMRFAAIKSEEQADLQALHRGARPDDRNENVDRAEGAPECLSHRLRSGWWREGTENQTWEPLEPWFRPRCDRPSEHGTVYEFTRLRERYQWRRIGLHQRPGLATVRWCRREAGRCYTVRSTTRLNRGADPATAVATEACPCASESRLRCSGQVS